MRDQIMILRSMILYFAPVDAATLAPGPSVGVLVSFSPDGNQQNAGHHSTLGVCGWSDPNDARWTWIGNDPLS